MVVACWTLRRIKRFPMGQKIPAENNPQVFFSKINYWATYSLGSISSPSL